MPPRYRLSRRLELTGGGKARTLSAMLRPTAIIVLLLAAVSFGADAPQPKSPAAVQAIAKSERAIKSAEDAFRAAKLASLKQLVQDLRGAIVAATKAGQLEEANAIKAAMDGAQGEIDALVNAGKAHRFVVKAGREWTETIQVTEGQQVSIQIDGQWKFGHEAKNIGRPEGEADGKRFGPIARVADGPSISVGAQSTLTADRDGIISLRLDGGAWNNDSGAVTAIVTVR
jgi:hypothetical protein